jgi:hypothetical protein
VGGVRSVAYAAGYAVLSVDLDLVRHVFFTRCRLGNVDI